MNQTYLSSTKNTVLSLKPSKAIRLLLMVLFVSLFANLASAQTTLFQFDFENSPIVPNINNAVGTAPAFSTSGQNLVGILTTSCQGSSRMLVSKNWDANSYYQFTVNTTGFANMTFSFCNRTDNTDIRNFVVRVSADNGITWNTVLTSYIPTTTNTTLTTATFPDDMNNAAKVLIQIFKTNYAANNGIDYFIDNATLKGCDIPTISTSATPAIITAVCQSSGAQTTTMAYTATTGTPKSYSIDWITLADQVTTISAFNSGTGSVTGITVPTNTPAGTYTGTMTITNANGCTAIKAVTLTVNALPSKPTVVITQATCAVPTGTITVTAPAPAAGITYTITGTNPVVVAVTNTAGVFSGLAAGNYNVTTTNGCTSSPTTAVIDPFVLVTNKWQGAAIGWSLGAPNENQNIEFAGNYDSTSDLTACSCQVNAGFYVNINTSHTLILTNGLSVVDTGNILFKDKSSLVQINNVSNEGNIEYERKISSNILPTDYTYWSSPVVGFTLGGVYSNSTSCLFYSYGVIAQTEDWQQELAAKVMAKGIGYIINGAQAGGPSNPPQSPTFKGVPNNGTITFPIGFTGATTAGTSNLLGNPYPSAIDADKFLTANATVLDGTLYFWTHNTALNLAGNIINPGPGWAYTYSLNDYASYNLTGGVGIENVKGGVSAPSGTGYPVLPSIIDLGKKPTGKIASGQGFFATSIKAGNVTFTNEMRVAGTSDNNSQFFKTKDLKGKTANTLEKNRIWLNLTNTQGAFKQTLIGYITDATNDYDNLFDGESFDGNEFVDFYSVNQDRNLVIQGRALPLEETDEVPLGYRTTIDGNFTINIDQVDGSLIDQAVFIEDKLTNTVFDLKNGNYTFSTTPGTFNDRFVLRYNNKTLGTENYDSPANKVIVSNVNKQIKINSFAEMIDKVVIYDLLGRQVFQKANVNNNELSIVNLISSHQTLVVKTLLQNGNAVTKKIIY